jgi:hypothetical protein
MRVAKHFSAVADPGQMVNKAHEPFADKSSQRPSTCLAGYDQMATRRNFKIGETEHLALQQNTTVPLID